MVRGSTSIILGLLIVAAIIVSTMLVGFLLSGVGEHAIDAASTRQVQPNGVADTLALNRQSLVQDNGLSVWLALCILVPILLAGLVVLALWRGEFFIRQFRLARKKKRRPSVSRQGMYLPPVGSHDTNPFPRPPAVRRAPVLPEENE